MTVREVFAICFPGVPEDATIHVGLNSGSNGPWIGPTFFHTTGYARWRDTRWAYTLVRMLGPDISSRPASSFVGFFGDGFDKAVEGEG